MSSGHFSYKEVIKTQYQLNIGVGSDVLSTFLVSPWDDEFIDRVRMEYL